MNDVVIERKDAKASGAKRYFTGIPCKHGHISERWTGSGECYDCNLIKQKAKRDANPERNLARVMAWRDKNRSAISEYNKTKYHADPEFHRNRTAEYRADFPEKVSAALKLWQAQNEHARKDYVAENRHKYRAYAMGRNAQKVNATVAWADIDVINSIYEAAVALSIETCSAFHVDHIVPLQSDFVCGLHVQDNLQILSASENMSKGNHWWPDMWT